MIEKPFLEANELLEDLVGISSFLWNREYCRKTKKFNDHYCKHMVVGEE